MNSLEKNKNYLLVAVSVVLIATILLFLTNKAYQRLIDVSKQLAAKSVELEDAQNKLSALQRQNRQIDVVEAKNQFALKQLPTELGATIFVSSLEKLNTIPVTVSVAATPAAGKVKKVKTLPESTSFNLTFNTDFPTILKFLQQMESLERLNSLNSISLSPSENGLGVSISGVIYTLKESK